MKVYGLTDSGLCRTENEDAYAVCRLFWQRRRHLFSRRPDGASEHATVSTSFGGAFEKSTYDTQSEPPSGSSATKEAMLAVVCDGMGGVSGGEIASRLATESFIDAISKDYAGDADSALLCALGAANDAVYARASADPSLVGMGTTVVAAVADEERVTVLHVGDSRAYLYHDGEVTLLTRDHSYVQELIDAGTLTEAEAKRHAKKNLITRAVGVGRTVDADLLRIPWETGDRLLLCSDGLSGYVDDDELSAILSETNDLCILAHELIGAANCKGGEDNITALLLENTKETKTHD